MKLGYSNLVCCFLTLSTRVYYDGADWQERFLISVFVAIIVIKNKNQTQAVLLQTEQPLLRKRLIKVYNYVYGNQVAETILLLNK